MEYWNSGIMGTEKKEKGMLEEWKDGMMGTEDKEKECWNSGIMEG